MQGTQSQAPVLQLSTGHSTSPCTFLIHLPSHIPFFSTLPPYRHLTSFYSHTLSFETVATIYSERAKPTTYKKEGDYLSQVKSSPSYQFLLTMERGYCYWREHPNFISLLQPLLPCMCQLNQKFPLI